MYSYINMKYIEELHKRMHEEKNANYIKGMEDVAYNLDIWYIVRRVDDFKREHKILKVNNNDRIDCERELDIEYHDYLETEDKNQLERYYGRIAALYILGYGLLWNEYGSVRLHHIKGNNKIL